MANDQSGKPDDLELLKQLDAIGEEFETGWNEDGNRPSIEDYLQQLKEVPSDRLVRELVSLEVELRLKAGEAPRADEYAERFPELARDWLAKVIVDKTALTASLRQDSDPDATFVRSDAPAKVDDSEQSTLAPSGQSNRTQSTAKFSSFGDYEIIDEIARGGMGVVYKARQKSLNRVVAMKMILSGQLAGEEEIQRFRSEAEAAANLDHPGIVPVYEIGEHDGHQFFSMGFVEGSSLQNTIIDGPLPPKEAAELTKKVAEAISYAHGKGVIHRDLKPANVLLDQNGEPKVTDFGLAKRIDSDSDLTRTTQAMGSPSWMPPEQASGKSSTVDARADVYALGAVLYNLITGRPPFQAATHLDTMMQVLEKEPVRPSTLDPKIPVDLETITLKCLEKDPDKRYQSSNDFSDELARFINGEPIHARPIGRIARTWRWCKRKPMATAAMVLSIALVLAIGAGSSIYAVMESNRAERAIRNKEAQARLTKEANDAKDKAEQNKTLAENQRDLAEEESDRAKEQLYVARIKDAGRARVDGEISRMLHVLGLAIPEEPKEKDLRGFEWYFNWNLIAKGVIRTWTNTGSCVAISSDGKWVAYELAHTHEIVIRDLNSDAINKTLFGHTAKVNDLFFFDREHVLISASEDGRVIIWDWQSGKQIRAFAGNHVALNEKNTLVAVGGTIESHSLRIYKYETGELIKEIENAVRSPIRFSSDGKALAHTNFDGKIVVRDTNTLEIRAELSNQRAPNAIVFDPKNSDRIFVAGNSSLNKTVSWQNDDQDESSTIQVWDLHTGNRVDTLYGHKGNVNCLAFDSTGSLLASGSDDRMVKVWDPKNGSLKRTLLGHITPITGLAFDQDGRKIASAAAEHQIVRFQDASNDQTSIAINEPSFRVKNAVFLANATQIATATVKSILLRDATTGDETFRLDKVDSDSFKFVPYNVSPSGRHSKSSQPETINAPPPFFSAFATSPDGKYFATGHYDGVVRVFDLKTKQPLQELNGVSGMVTSLAFEKSSSFLAAASDQKNVKVWRNPSGELIRELPGVANDGEQNRMPSRGAPIQIPTHNSTVAFSPDGRLIAVGCLNGEFSIHDLKSGVQIINFPNLSSELNLNPTYGTTTIDLGGFSDEDRDSFLLFTEIIPEHQSKPTVMFSPDGTTLACTNLRKEVLLYDASSGNIRHRLTGHNEPVEDFDFSPDGKRLVTASRDATVRIWNVSTGQELISLKGHSGPVYCVSFSDNGSKIISASADKQIRIWDATPNSEGYTEIILSQSYKMQKDFDSELKYLKKAQMINEQNFGKTDRRTLDLKSSIASHFFKRKQFSEAASYYEEVLSDSKNDTDESFSLRLAAMSNLANVKFQLGEVDRGIELMQQLIQIRTKELGATHPRTVNSVRNLGAFLFSAGKRSEGQKYLLQAYELSPTDVKVNRDIAMVRQVYSNERDNDSSINFLEQIVDVGRKKKIATPAQYDFTAELAKIYQIQGRKDEARQLRQEKRAIERALSEKKN